MISSEHLYVKLDRIIELLEKVASQTQTADQLRMARIAAEIATIQRHTFPSVLKITSSAPGRNHRIND